MKGTAMDMNRNWTAFAVEAEYDAYGAARLCAAHNALRFEVESLRVAMNVMKAAMPEPEVDGDVFVQPVPDHCDRITWRNEYYHLPPKVGADGTAKPVAWIRFCSDGCYEGPIMDEQIEEVRKNSGAWTPLYARHNVK
jgi:hypothetical protein